MSSLAWTETARSDLQEIYDFVARDSIAAADRLVDQLIAAGERAVEFPESGRVVPEFGRRDLREIIAAPYRLVYLLAEDGTIHILTVRHGSRLLPGSL